MTSSTKKRIVQLRQGQVPKGYRLTRLGIVPSDWVMCRIGECLKRVERPVEVQADNLYTQIGIRSHGKGLFYKEQVTGTELGNKAVFWIEPNCFILNIVFAWEQAIGKTTQAEEGMIGSHRFPMYRPINDRVDIDYLINYFLTKRGTEILEAASPGGAGRNKTLGQDRFLKSKIVLPPLAEQRTIAKILAAQDRVIELKKKLFEETKRRKKALVRMLMEPTGLKRLEAASRRGAANREKAVSCRFRHGEMASCHLNDEWQRLSFGDCFHLLRNNTYSRSFMAPNSVGIANVHYGDVLTKFDSILDFSVCEVDSLVADASIVGDLLEDGDIVIADTAEDSTCGKAVEIQALGNRKAVAGLHTIACRPMKGRFEPKWIGYFINSEVFHGQLLPLMVGSKVLSITRQSLLSTTVILPPLSIQRQIAAILSAADREIALLRQNLEQEERKKKALMQLLLTGIVRVSVKGDDVGKRSSKMPHLRGGGIL